MLGCEGECKCKYYADYGFSGRRLLRFRPVTPQGKIKGRYSVNAGLSQYFLNRKLCANLSINNIFDSLEETTIIDAPNLEMTQKRNRDARVAWLTLTYSL